jgi:hypothetical protein
MATRAPSATNSFAVASPMPLLPPVINAVLFASLMAASSGCIIKLDCLTRASGFIMQLHKAVIDPRETAMVKRTSFEHDECPIARSLDAIGDWWSLLIIRDALLGVAASANSRRAWGSPRTS